MKNTLVFLVTEGIGLNKKWKGNYLKLANKPNINHLISGIYPWALLSNDKKRHKTILKKSFSSIKTDTDSNYYEMLYGETSIKTYLELLEEQINSKSLHNLEVFNNMLKHSQATGSKLVHIFSMLSFNKNKFNLKNLFFIINVLIKKGLKPVLHLIGDGQDERPYSFNKSIIDFSKFLSKRNTPIITIAGRNHVFGKKGQSHLLNNHVFNYFETICGLGNNAFSSALEYANENLANQVMDADILPGYNGLIDSHFLSEKDNILFLNADPDDFSSLASMIKSEPKFYNSYISSLAPIYGIEVDNLFFKNPVAGKEEELLTNAICKNENNNVLVLGLNHKKGFINKFFGKTNNNPKIERKILSTPNCSSDKDYFNLAPKILFDKAINSIGKYDVIFVMLPMIAEAAKTSNLKQLSAAIESFDNHLGRLINICRSTGNIIALTSAFGAAEKMLDKHLNIVPNNKSSLVPFVFTNGDLSAKKMKTNFLGVYSSILSTVETLDEQHKLFYTSLIDPNFTKNKIEEKLNDSFVIWKETISDDLIKNFEENRLNFYSEFSKDEQFLSEKQKYIVLKEIMDINSKILLTPEARKKLYNILINYVEYNKIDFVGLDINYKKMFQTLFNDEIRLQKVTKISNKYFDRKIWSTNFLKNDKWIDSVKFNLLENTKRSVDVSKHFDLFNKVYESFLPFLFFKKIRNSEYEILKTNDSRAIVEFYDSVKDEVENIYMTYIDGKVRIEGEESDDMSEEDVDELLDRENEEFIEAEKKLYSISKYYEYFKSTLEIVEEFRNNVDACQYRYEENIDYLRLNGKKYEYDDLYSAPQIALNPLTFKIISFYKLYKNEINTYYKSLSNNIKKASYKFNSTYLNKLNLAKEAIFYNEEFEENVALDKQEEFQDKFSKYVDIYKEFDNTIIEWEDPETVSEDDEDDDESRVELDENGNEIVIDSIDVKIKTRPEYNLTDKWVQKRIDEYKNVDNLKANIAIDAQDKIIAERKVKDAKKRVNNYNNLSEIWKANNKTELERN